MSVLMKSVSGIRGIVGDTVTPELIVQVGKAFASFCKGGTVIVGRDSRPTGAAIANGIISSLSLSGCGVIDVGIVPTPTVQVMVEEHNAAGGIIISASHNPIEWNAFKLVNKSGSFLNSKEIEKFFSLMEKDFRYKKWDKIGTITTGDAADLHINMVLSLVDVKAIKKQKYKIVLDSVNGAGSLITQDLLKQLGCTVVPVHCEMNGIFPRGAEPLPDNLKILSETVIKHKAHIGFAQDPDADRLAIVDEVGRPLGEEYTVTLATEHLLSKETGPVVVNLSTTKAVEDIAHKYNSSFSRAKVGEINVVEMMKKKKARIGGEGNGGVISPEAHFGRDSLIGIGYILDMMAKRKMSISELRKSLPDYIMRKGKVAINPDTFDSSILDSIKDTFKQEKITTIDGLRIDFKKDEKMKGGWVHLRSSNTEPIFRIIAEGKDKNHTDLIYNTFSKYFK